MWILILTLTMTNVKDGGTSIEIEVIQGISTSSLCSTIGSSWKGSIKNPQNTDVKASYICRRAQN